MAKSITAPALAALSILTTTATGMALDREAQTPDLSEWLAPGGAFCNESAWLNALVAAISKNINYSSNDPVGTIFQMDSARSNLAEEISNFPLPLSTAIRGVSIGADQKFYDNYVVVTIEIEGSIRELGIQRISRIFGLENGINATTFEIEAPLDEFLHKFPDYGRDAIAQENSDNSDGWRPIVSINSVYGGAGTEVTCDSST